MVTLTSRKPVGPSSSAVRTTILCGLVGALCFYCGMLLGSLMNCSCRDDVPSGSEANNFGQSQHQAGTPVDEPVPKSMHDIVRSFSAVDRDDFAKTFDMGVPLDPSSSNNNQVLVLHNSNSSPSENTSSSGSIVAARSVEDAMQNCDFLNIVLQDHGRRRQCVAIMGQYEAFHLQKFMRLPEGGGKLDGQVPLRFVNRGAHSSGRLSTRPPPIELNLQAWKTLAPYLANLQDTLDRLKPVAESVAKDNTIIVLVCNQGQSELLINFICAANSRGLSLNQVLVFATDEETRDLATGMGVAVFYEPSVFGGIPKNAARRYADMTFQKVMMAKVYCVHLISMLGYDLLFQDVDVIWYKNPLEYFENQKLEHYDVYFQDDGNHAIYYAPYSANTGFYFVRYSDKTRHFFNSLLMAGDLILQTKSHQVPLVALLQEHASMYGLQIKIWGRQENDFPGGHAFHQRKGFMKLIIEGKAKPYIFHMSWTQSKDNKVKYLEQFGEWYVNDQCVQKTAKDALPDGSGVNGALVQTCCNQEAIVRCHYRDKPSKTPCKDSPTIDKNGRSFW